MGNMKSISNAELSCRSLQSILNVRGDHCVGDRYKGGSRWTVSAGFLSGSLLLCCIVNLCTEAQTMYTQGYSIKQYDFINKHACVICVSKEHSF